MNFSNSKALFDAGYAVAAYDIETNTNRWRFRSESFTTPIIINFEYANVNGHIVPVYPINKLKNICN